MSADLLRETAQLVRQRAQWCIDHGDGDWYDARQLAGYFPTDYSDDTKAQAHADAEHIASWHPAVALAVADWLDHLALMALDWEPYKGCGWDGVDHALTVARAYLGRDA